MRNERITKATRKVLAGLLAAAVIISGMAVIPAYAANESEEVITPDLTKEIKYVPYATAVSSMNAENVPVRKDYVFGGWYQKDAATDTFTAMRTAPTSTDANLYAKFVPAYVLSVKTQIDAYTAEKGANTDQNATLRVLSAVDDLNYQEVGFEIWLGSRTAAESTPVITKVYQGLKLNENDTTTITPEDTFGVAADYFSALNLLNITKNSHASIVYVRPYWKTLDGTTVKGMARNLHVEDEYNDYISVPVNLLSGTPVAGGKLVMTYDKDTLEVVSDTGFEAGRLLTEMAYHVNEAAGTITIVGNATTPGTNVSANGLFANIRFKKKTGKTASAGAVLTQSESQFCNWAEEDASVEVWDYKN